ncbi:MAG: hypothetical protein M1836_003670 [Candelina mexicana]|nr:MAG: hypothetical protein M1836_003670 [Candelina mexicana]
MKITISALTLGFITAIASALPAEEYKPTACTTTLTRLAHFEGGATTTVFAKTVTATSSVDCHGCGAVYVKTIGGLGPVRIITATVTAPVTTTTTTVCTPSIR